MVIRVTSVGRVLFLFFLALLSNGLYAQNIVFPDVNFKAFCVANYDGIDGSATDNEVSVAEAAAVTGTMNCSSQSIVDLTGVGYFINIVSLDCYSNQLTSLPDLAALTSLQYLNCYSNQLATLPPLTTLTSLQTLDCHSNQLTSLPVLTTLPLLRVLECRSNLLTSLPDLTNQTNLQYLYCYSNQLTSLPSLTTLTSLRYLYCYSNQLTSLPSLTTLTSLLMLSFTSNQVTSLPPLTTLTNLVRLECSANLLTSLPDLTALTSLQRLYCSSNQLTSLPSLTTLTSLQRLYCSDNQLSSLPSLTTLTSLENLYCDANQLTSLPVLTTLVSLVNLRCYTNLLTSLPDLTTLPNLKNLYCYSNQLTSLPDPAGVTGFDNLYIHNNNLDYDDCPDIEAIEALNLIAFSYNPQNDGSTLDCSCLPAISTHPDSAFACLGDSVTFSVTATGLDPLTYQWRKNGVAILGGTSASYTINPVAPNQAGLYDCVVNNSCGSDTSDAAALTVYEPIAITVNPIDTTICPGESVSFCVEATGTDPITYQWYKDGYAVTGATDSCLEFDSVTADDTGACICELTNICGTEVSAPAFLTVDGPLEVAIDPPCAAQGIAPLDLSALLTCAVPELTWYWTNLTTGIPFGNNQNPVTLDVMSETTTFELSVTDGITREVASSVMTVLVHESGYVDLNTDSCNNLLDLWLLAEDWRQSYLDDPNDDGIIDVRDFLYINLDDSLGCVGLD